VNFWTAHPGFMQTFADSWNKLTHESNSAANICTNFKILRYDLKFWSKYLKIEDMYREHQHNYSWGKFNIRFKVVDRP
jgi:hypothetical protein